MDKRHQENPNCRGMDAGRVACRCEAVIRCIRISVAKRKQTVTLVQVTYMHP